jgi:hypothetical protein
MRGRARSPSDADERRLDRDRRVADERQDVHHGLEHFGVGAGALTDLLSLSGQHHSVDGAAVRECERTVGTAGELVIRHAGKVRTRRHVVQRLLVRSVPRCAASARDRLDRDVLPVLRGARQPSDVGRRCGTQLIDLGA